jgi:hypothetical protein
LGSKPSGAQQVKNLRHIFNPNPTQLDILSGREVTDPAAKIARNRGNCAYLMAGENAI